MIRKLFPFLNWFPMTKEGIRADVMAGITVALFLIPQSMAYAELAGLPAYYGLYASVIPVIIGALWGHVPQLASGPVAISGILTFSILSYHAPGDATKYIQLAILLAIVVGVVRIVIGALKLSSIINLISHPVIIGFTNGCALIICMSQINKIFGLEKASNQGVFAFVTDFTTMLKGLGSMTAINYYSIALGIGTMLMIWFIKKKFPKFPSMLTAVVVTTFLSWKFGFVDMGGKVVGDIPAGLKLTTPQWNWEGSENISMFAMAIKLLPDAIVLCFIGFMEMVAISKAVSLQTKQPLNLDQELIGQGVSSIGGGFSNAYPTSVSFSRSAMNLMLGAKTGLCNIVAALVVVIVLFFFTHLLFHLPKATLAAGIIMAVYPLIKFRPISLALKASKADGLAAIITFAATILYAPKITNGVFIGAGIAIILHLYRTMKPEVQILDTYDELTGDTSAKVALSSEVIAMRFSGSIYFASVSYFETMLLKAINKKPDAQYIILDSRGINRIDASGEWGLRQLLERLDENNFQLVFAGLQDEPFSVLERTGLVEDIGREHFYKDVDKAIDSIHSSINESAFMI